MTTWQLHTFDHNCTVLPEEITGHVTSNPEHNICLSFRSVDDPASTEETIAKLLSSAREHRHIIAVFIAGQVGGWLTALALSSDLVFSTLNSSFSISGLNGVALSEAATSIGSRLPRTRAIQFFLDGDHDCPRLKQLGLITEIVNESNVVNPVEFLSSFINEEKESAIIKLKEVWRKTQSIGKQDALTVERLEFSKCFEQGAAESIAAYLQNRFKTE